MGREVDRRKRCKGVLSRVHIMGYPGMIKKPGFMRHTRVCTRVFTLGYVPKIPCVLYAPLEMLPLGGEAEVYHHRKGRGV